MPSFSKRSTSRLAQCDPRLQHVFQTVIQHYNCTILEGYRDEKRQNKLFHEGKSRVVYPVGKHNRRPYSLAVDAAPWPVMWDNLIRFYHFGGYVLGVAHSLGIDLRWGGDWDSDLCFTDQRFNDLVHFELRGSTTPGVPA